MKILVAATLVITFALSASPALAGVALSCAVKVAALLASDNMTAGTPTSKFKMLLKMAAVDKLVPNEVLQAIIEKSAPFNPLDEDVRDRTRSHVFRIGFDKLLAFNLDWDEIQNSAREILKERNKTEERSGRAAENTRQIPVPMFQKDFSVNSGAWGATSVFIDDFDGRPAVVVPTGWGLYVASVPDLKIISKFVEFNGKTLNDVDIYRTPLVYRERGRWKAAVDIGRTDYAIVDLKNPKVYSKLNVPDIPRSDPAFLQWKGRNFSVFGASNSGLTVVDLTLHRSFTIELEETIGEYSAKEIYAYSRPAVYFDGDAPMALVNTSGKGTYLINLKTKKVAHVFEGIGESESGPALYEKEGKRFAIVGAKSGWISILNLTDQKIEKEFPGNPHIKANPVVFSYEGRQYAALGSYFTDTFMYVIDLDTNSILHKLNLHEHLWGHPAVVYGDTGYPYVVQVTPNNKLVMLDPLTGIIAGSIDIGGNAQGAPLIFKSGGRDYALSGQSQGTKLFSLFNETPAAGGSTP